MTELQMGLIGLGAVAVVGVMAYNKWQEYRQRKLAEQILNASHRDVLLDAEASERDLFEETGNVARDATEAEDPVAIPIPVIRENTPVAVQPPEPEIPLTAASSGGRIEPVLRLDPEPEPLEQAPDTQAQVPAEAFHDAAEAPMPETVAPALAPTPAAPLAERKSAEFGAVAEPVHLLSQSVDFIAAIEAVEPAPVEQILEAQREALARVRKPIRWVGYNEYSGEWETILGRDNAEYRHIRAGLQLVNRQGPASDSDLAYFCVAMQDLADRLMGIADLPARQPALEAAVKLDEFCAGVDIQIGINVISQGGQVFPGTKLRALAEAAGMTIDAEKRFVRRDDDGNLLYLMLNQDASGFSADMMKTMSTHGVTFLLDVPRVAHGDRVFNQMVDQARRFAEVLHGALVDDNRRPLSENALEPIRRQVGQFQSLMAAHQFPAGSPLAKRLFS